MRPTWAEIDTEAVVSNFNQIKNTVGPDVSILAVVKADAYGHGAVEISKTLVGAGADMLGVATVEEAMELRESGIDGKIVLLSGIQKDEAFEVVKHDLTPTCYLVETLEAISNEAVKQGKQINYHLKVDTGMTRLGIRNGELCSFFSALGSYRNLNLEGVFTHLSCADEIDNTYTEYQLHNFGKTISELAELKYSCRYKHVANSSAIQLFPASHYNLVRPGILLYGSGNLTGMDIKTVMRLKTRIVQIKKVPGNTPVSYGGTYVTNDSSVLAVLPIGYADGYLRKLSNRARVSVNGTLCPVVGAVCMDLILIDVTGVPGVQTGTEVVLFGDDLVTIEKVSEWAETIPYEIMSIIGKRVPRIYP